MLPLPSRINPTLLPVKPSAGQGSGMLHLIKLSVGTTDLADLAAWQAGQMARGELPCHRTRMAPRRAAEILAGGSIYWVIGGAVRGRQRVRALDPDRRPESGEPCTRIGLEPTLVPVWPRAMRPFQGWRYLNPADAPADLDALDGPEPSLPLPLRRALQELALLP